MSILSYDINTPFKEVYLQYWKPIYLFLVFALRDDQQAQDIAQECFVELYKHWAELNFNNNHIRNFLYKTAKHRLNNYWRHQKIKQKGDLIFGKQYYQQDSLAAEEIIESLIEKLESLPDHQRKALIASLNHRRKSDPPLANSVNILACRAKKTLRQIFKVQNV